MTSELLTKESISKSEAKLQKLKDLRAECYSCDRCPLHQTSVPLAGNPTPYVFSSGKARSRIFVVGQNPGLNEVHSKKPFVGTAGTKLNQALEKAGIERSDIYITNSVLCYTANNSKPPIESINACKYYLKAQLEILEPSIVIVMGASASRSFNFDGEFSVKLCEEQKIYNTDMHSKVMFTVHPMFTIYAGDRGMNILVKSFEIAKSNLD